MTAATLTLTDFLLARIAEDEARYRRDQSEYGYGWRRMLAECEAKRRIVSRCSSTLMDEWQDAHDREWSEERDVREFTLRALAAVYADHPDYRDEWRP